MTKTGNKVAPTSTVLQARVLLFQPSQRPVQRTGEWLETEYGTCRVRGRLGQRHADVLEAILYVAERIRDDGASIDLLVDPYQLRKNLGSEYYSHQGLLDLLADLRAATIEIITPELKKTGDRIIGGLIDHVVPSPMTRTDPLTGEEREMWRVRLGVALITLLNKDLSLYYKPAPIAALRHGISQAVARHVLTHKIEPRGGWRLDTLIRAVAGDDANSQTMRNARRRVREDAEQLLKIGISLNKENNRIQRVKNE